MIGSSIEYETRNGEKFGGYLVKPDGEGAFPGILLITAIFGIDDEMKQDVTGMLQNLVDDAKEKSRPLLFMKGTPLLSKLMCFATGRQPRLWGPKCGMVAGLWHKLVPPRMGSTGHQFHWRWNV